MDAIGKERWLRVKRDLQKTYGYFARDLDFVEFREISKDGVLVCAVPGDMTRTFNQFLSVWAQRILRFWNQLFQENTLSDVRFERKPHE